MGANIIISLFFRNKATVKINCTAAALDSCFVKGTCNYAAGFSKKIVADPHWVKDSRASRVLIKYFGSSYAFKGIPSCGGGGEVNG